MGGWEGSCEGRGFVPIVWQDLTAAQSTNRSLLQKEGGRGFHRIHIEVGRFLGSNLTEISTSVRPSVKAVAAAAATVATAMTTTTAATATTPRTTTPTATTAKRRQQQLK